MDAELLKQLVSDPARWPFYVLLAAVVVFVLKVLNVAAEAVVKRLSDKIKKQKGWVLLCKGMIQVIAIALLIYCANALYWSRYVPRPTTKPITTCSVTVEMVIASDDKSNFHFMDSGGYLAFWVKDRALLVASSEDSYGRSVATNEYRYRGVFQMDTMDSAVGKPVEMLKEAEYVQVEFSKMPSGASLIRGKAICVINSELRFELLFPSQEAEDKKLFLSNLDSFKEALE